MDTITVNRKSAAPEPTTPEPKPKKSRKFGRSALVKLLLALVVVGSVATAVIMTMRYNNLKKDPNQITAQQQKSLTEKIGKLIELPKDEQPSIATVSDKAKLQEQAFFKNAENGDTLLIYTNARKAILYRESANKVVEVAPIALDTTGTEGTTPATPTTTTPAKKP